MRFEKRTTPDRWWLIEEGWTGCTWRIVACEPLTDISVEVG